MNFSLEVVGCVVGGVEDVVTVFESMGGGRGSDEGSCIEPKGCEASEIGDLLEGAEEIRGTSFF